MSENEKQGFRMTGGKVLGIFMAVFGVVFTVNIYMAYSAVSTFPGLEVANSYVASQEFNDRLVAQQALGWEVAVEVDGGELLVHFTDIEGNPVSVAAMNATLGRATHTREDVEPEFTYRRGTFRAPVALESGYWHLRLLATAPDGTEFQQRVAFRHSG